jgi:tRNA pseudouridine38-40 synthase
MARYFLELAYKGTRYSGFQVQDNAITVQFEVERALEVYLRGRVGLTGSSRTDAGVHAEQNFFHFDWEGELPQRFLYNLNAILPGDIVLKSVRAVAAEAHCRFQASSREYSYLIYRAKDPFLEDRAWYFPYALDLAVMREAAGMVLGRHDFAAFSKRNTQVKTTICTVVRSEWIDHDFGWEYRVEANRFLRGMVRGLVGTMVKAGRGKMDAVGFKAVLDGGDQAKADFSAPGRGLFLKRVRYPEGVLR